MSDTFMADVQFANLSIRFGDKELLDFKELVTGAFLKDTYVRKYGRSSYHFASTEIGFIRDDDPMSLAIWGQFVKETELIREQYYDGNQLIHDEQTLPSAPSSFFVFFIADHRIAFIPETKFAPTLENLETTVRKFVKAEFAIWESETYKIKKAEDASYTWAKLREEFKSPTVALVPLTGKESIKEFVNRFKVIESLTVYVVKRNQDFDGGEIFDALEKTSEKLNATSARFVMKGDKDEGLDLENASEFIEETTRGGYERVNVSGVDERGETLKGTNEDFKLTAHLNTRDLTKLQVVREALRLYEANKESGVIKVSPRDADTLGPILRDLLGNRNAS